MTDWKFSGEAPPLSKVQSSANCLLGWKSAHRKFTSADVLQADWEHEFSKYQQSPEFKQVNRYALLGASEIPIRGVPARHAEAV